ncbi:MAG: hypothetical protein ABH826_01015, partial [Patescibacteria group bacterium]
YIMDKAYVDYSRLFSIHQQQAFFATRAKVNMSCKRVYSRPVDKANGLRCDQSVSLIGPKAKKNYPELLRRVKFFDSELDRTFEFISNNFSVSAMMIALLYKERWQVEFFFYGKLMIMQSGIIKYAYYQPISPFTLQYHFA